MPGGKARPTKKKKISPAKLVEVVLEDARAMSASYGSDDEMTLRLASRLRSDLHDLVEMLEPPDPDPPAEFHLAKAPYQLRVKIMMYDRDFCSFAEVEDELRAVAKHYPKLDKWLKKFDEYSAATGSDDLTFNLEGPKGTSVVLEAY